MTNPRQPCPECDGYRTVEVPHSDQVERCKVCNGLGSVARLRQDSEGET